MTQTVTPYLLYEDGVAAIDFLTRAFGFREVNRATGAAGGLHAELAAGSDGARVYLGQPPAGYRNHAAVGITSEVYVLVDDVDAHYARAVAAGASIIEEPNDLPFGHRRYGCRDPQGHEWFFAQPLRAPAPDVAPFLSYEDCGTAADWLVHALGLEEVERLTDDGKVGHVTLRSGAGIVYLGSPDGYVDPLRLRAEAAAVARVYDVPWVVDGVFVSVDDLDGACERVRTSGGCILTEPEDTPRGRSVRVEDPAGHRWYLQER